MKFIAIMVLTLFLSGCAATSVVDNSSLTTQLPIQYATLKLIEKSNRIDPTDVIATVQTARTLMKEEDQEVDLGFLSNGVRTAIDWESLATSDKVLISALITEIEGIISRQYDIDTGLSEAAKIRISTLLDYVESAAHMAQ